MTATPSTPAETAERGSRLADRLGAPGLVWRALGDPRMPRRVITLDEARFDQACRDLARIATRRFAPDFVIGIRTGGAIVAERMRPELPRDCRVLPISKRRPSTALKRRAPWRNQVLRAVPYAVTDRIRLLEHRLLMTAAAGAGARPASVFTPDPAESGPIVAALAAAPEARVLVVDDSIDSGATMLAVKSYLAAVAPGAEIRAAAIVVTHYAPAVRPEFGLYSRVLCRFPWSDDFKPTDPAALAELKA